MGRARSCSNGFTRKTGGSSSHNRWFGRCVIAWVDYRFDEQGDIFIQHLNSDGETLMDDNGIALAQVEGKQIQLICVQIVLVECL